MTDLLPDPGDDWQVKLKRLLLDVDARIDFAVYQSGNWARELYERFTAFMDNCHVAGWRRWLFIEPLSEMATLGTGGIILMLRFGAAVVPRDLGRRLAQKVRARGVVPRPLRRRGRHPRHQAQ